METSTSWVSNVKVSGIFLYPLCAYKKIRSPNSQNEDIQSPMYVKVIILTTLW
jgi:hypothetical protein